MRICRLAASSAEPADDAAVARITSPDAEDCTCRLTHQNAPDTVETEEAVSVCRAASRDQGLLEGLRDAAALGPYFVRHTLAH
jgi:hypothetical protein